MMWLVVYICLVIWLTSCLYTSGQLDDQLNCWYTSYTSVPAFLPFGRCGLSGWNAGALVRSCLSHRYACASGCGCWYSGIPHNTSRCRTSFSLRTEAEPCRGILARSGTCVFFYNVLVVYLSLLVLQGTHHATLQWIAGHPCSQCASPCFHYIKINTSIHFFSFFLTSLF